MATTDKRDLLARNYMFCDVDPAVVDRVAELGVTIRLKSGQELFRKGDDGNALFSANHANLDTPVLVDETDLNEIATSQPEAIAPAERGSPVRGRCPRQGSPRCCADLARGRLRRRRPEPWRPSANGLGCSSC